MILNFLYILSVVVLRLNGKSEVRCQTNRFEGENPVISKLEKYNVDNSSITVSGFSAGAAMANQINVAHSSHIAGVAVFSQVFYRCGPGSLIEFGLRCSKTGLGIFPYKVDKSIEDALSYEKEGLIDPLEHLKRQKIYIWSGHDDEYIPPDMAEKNLDFYQHFIHDSNRVNMKIIPNTVHVFPTIDFGDKCDKDAEKNYYLGSCGYSGVYESLKYLLEDRIQNSTNKQLTENQDLSPLLQFDQTEFYPEGIITQDAAMGKIGFLYVPSKCQDKKIKCLLHFNFHGCNEWPPEVAYEYIMHSGFLPVAEMNNIITIFPLTTKVPANMGGCWDFFSHTGPNFATKRGTQIKIVFRMLQRILYGNEIIKDSHVPLI